MNAGIKAKHLLNGALFPVSAGAVAAEIAIVGAIFMKSDVAADIAGRAGVVAAAAALVFQIATYMRQ